MDVSFNFTFFKHTHTEREGLTNDEQYNLRREVARMMQRCGFGDVVEEDIDHFANIDIAPLDDEYYNDQEELFICYYWSDRHIQDEPPLDDRLANVVSSANGVPSIRRYLDANYPNIDFVSRIIWS